jgi:DNA-binding transcriptional regulator LsrR (DeoR family)
MAKQCRKGINMNNNTTKYAILYLVNQGIEQKEIAKELGIKLTEVKKHMPKPVKDKQNNIRTTSSRTNSKDLMIMETSGKGTKNVSIMTKSASEVNDAFKKTIQQPISRTTKNSIFQMKKK